MIKQKFFLDFSSKTIHHMMQAVGGIVVAIFAGPNIVGTIAYGLAFVGVFNFLNGLLVPAHIKIISETNNEKDCNTTFVILKIIFSTIFIFMSLAFYLFNKYYLLTNFENVYKEWIIFISIGIVFFQNIIKIPEGIFISRMNQARLNLPYLLNGIFYNIFRSILAFLGFGAVVLSSVPIVVSLLLIPFYIYLLRDINFGNFNKEIAKKYLTISKPLFIMVFSNTTAINLSRLILEYYTSTISLGLFIVGNNIAGILGLISGTAGSLFFPLFSKAVKNKNIQSIKSYIKKYNRILFIWILPFVILLCLFSKNLILLILGKDYIESADVFSIIIFSSFLQMWAIPFGNVLFSFNKFNISALISLIRLFVQVFFVTIFVHPSIFNYGVTSLALAIFISDFFILLIRYFFSKKILDINIFKNNIYYIIYSVFFYLLYYLIIIPYSLNINIIVIMLSFVLLFYTFMYLFSMFNKKDIEFVKNIISYKKMKAYLKNDLYIK